MSSTRERPLRAIDRLLRRAAGAAGAVAAASIAVLASTGCQRANVSSPEPLSAEPVVIDEAMALRQWAPVNASYPNGSTVTGPTGFAYEPRRGMEDWRYYYADPLVFLGNTGALPFWLVRTPPWSEVVYDGVVIPPTHHAMPPLPPERGTAAGRGVVVVEETPSDDLPAPAPPPPPDAPPAESPADAPAPPPPG